MLDFHQKRKVRSLLYNRITIGVLLVLVLIVAHSTFRVYQKKRDSEKMRDISMVQVEELRKRELELRSKIERLETEQGVEEEIRSKFSVAKQDENMVLVVLQQETGTSTSTPKKGFWSRIKGLFGSN